MLPSMRQFLFFTAYGGMVVNARLKSGENIDIGEGLISGANGVELKAAGALQCLLLSLLRILVRCNYYQCPTPQSRNRLSRRM